MHLLSEGHFMKVDYEDMKSLFKQLQVKNYPHKHWSNSLGWIMAKHVHNVMLDTMWWPMAKVKFLSISCEEITNIDNQTWASVHVYVVQEWCKVPILFLRKYCWRNNIWFRNKLNFWSTNNWRWAWEGKNGEWVGVIWC